MNRLLLLALAVPFGCLAFLSLLVLLGVMMLGAVIHVLDTLRARRPQWPSVEPANSPAATMLKAPQEARKKTMEYKTYSILPFEEQYGRDLCPGREGHVIS
jgi:hypothetical protein